MAIQIKVPQKDGEITITAGSAEPRTWKVTDSTVSAQNEAEALLLIDHAGGVPSKQ